MGVLAISRRMSLTDVTPALPAPYRQRALAALATLIARGAGVVRGHRATVDRLTAANGEAATARAELNAAEQSLSLLRGRRRFLRAEDRPPSD